MALSNDDREFVERRINDMDRRRDENLSYKLEAVEKLFQLAVNTKAEALRVALERLQDDGRGCAVKCANQVKIFRDAIAEITSKCAGRYECIKEFKHDLEDGKSFLRGVRRDLDATKVRVAANEEAIADFNTWRKSYLIRNVIIAVASAFAVCQLAFIGFTWVIDYLSKVGK